MCLKSIDEPDQYFTMPQQRRAQLLELFGDHRVTAVFSGHYHRNAYVKHGNLELVTTSSTGKPLGPDPTGFRIVKVSPNRIQHAYYTYDNMPTAVES
jgi:predicted phosphodiesterase